MAISNNMATSHVRIVSLPLSKFPFSCLHVRSTGELCYRRLHHHHVARATGPLPCSLSSFIQPPLDVGVAQECQADKQIWEIREELGSIESRDLRGVETLNDALLLVDLIQWLGIQRHFVHHINGILHSIYSGRIKWLQLPRKLHGKTNTIYSPPLEDYMSGAEVSVAGVTCILTSIFSMEELITKEAWQSINKDSRFMHLVCAIGRLGNDVATFKHEESVEEMASSISCYMRDNPHCTQDEAITSVRCNIESACREVELEHFNFQVEHWCPNAVVGYS